MSVFRFFGKATEPARAKKLDMGALRGKAGVAPGAADGSDEEWGQQYDDADGSWEDVNAVSLGESSNGGEGQGLRKRIRRQTMRWRFERGTQAVRERGRKLSL